MEILIGFLLFFSIISLFLGLILLCIKSTRYVGRFLALISIGGFVVSIAAVIMFGDNKNQNSTIPETNVAETKEQTPPVQTENNQASVADTSNVTEQAPTAKTDNDNNQTQNTTANAEDSDQKNTETEAPKRNPNLNPEKNIKRITTYLKSKKIKWKPFGERLCTSDNYCSIYVGSVLIRAVGGIVNVDISNEVSSAQYIKTCAMVLSGLSGITQEQTLNYVVQGFREGAHSTWSKYRIGDVDMTIRTSSDSRLVCDFFRKTL